MNKLTEQYKKERKKYNIVSILGMSGIVVFIVLDIVFNKTLFMLLALLSLGILVFADIKDRILVREYKNLENYLKECKRLKNLNDKIGLQELESTLSKRQRSRLECMKNSKSEQS